MTAPKRPPQVDVSHHLGLAHLACKSFRSHVGRGFDYEDLVQAALEGLLYAAATFDETKGTFSTYAVPMARKFVKRLVATNTRTVACPEYLQDRVAAQGRPTTERPAVPRERRTTGGPFDWASAPAPVRPAHLEVTSCPYEGVPSTWVRSPDAEQVHSPGAELSLDFAGEDGDSTMHDYLDSGFPTPEALAAWKQSSAANDALWAAMGRLSEKQFRVVALRLEGRTGPAIAAELGLSKERVRQIQNDATAILAEALAPKPNLN